MFSLLTGERDRFSLGVEASFDRLSKSGITELMAFRQPPTSVVQIFEGLAVLLAPSKRMFDWNDIRKWLGSHVNQLLTMLINYNKDQVTEEQLTRLTSILALPECEPERVRKCSLAGYELCLWLIAVAQYSTLQRHYQQTT